MYTKVTPELRLFRSNITNPTFFSILKNLSTFLGEKPSWPSADRNLSFLPLCFTAVSSLFYLDLNLRCAVCQSSAMVTCQWRQKRGFGRHGADYMGKWSISWYLASCQLMNITCWPSPVRNLEKLRKGKLNLGPSWHPRLFSEDTFLTDSCCLKCRPKTGNY